MRSILLHHSKHLRWSTTAGTNPNGEPRFHDLLAMKAVQDEDFGTAQYHFLRGCQPEEFAKMINQCMNEAPPSERDLFVARAVLQ